METDPDRRSDEGSPISVPAAADALLGVGLDVFRFARRGTEAIIRTTSPVTGFVLRPTVLPQRLWPATAVTAAVERGRRERLVIEHYVSTVVHALAPRVIELILDEMDLTEIVLDRVDLDRAVAAVDIDAIAARLDMDAIIDKVPIDRVIDRVDVDAVADKLDLDRAVKRLDVDAVIATADVDGVVSKVNLDAIIGRIDLVGIVGRVLDELDLPEIIRQSTGSMASETVRGVRMRSFEADQRINRTVSRFMPHRKPADPGSEVHGD
jgi:hypothetical protein